MGLGSAYGLVKRQDRKPAFSRASSQGVQSGRALRLEHLEERRLLAVSASPWLMEDAVGQGSDWEPESADGMIGSALSLSPRGIEGAGSFECLDDGSIGDELYSPLASPRFINGGYAGGESFAVAPAGADGVIDVHAVLVSSLSEFSLPPMMAFYDILTAQHLVAPDNIDYLLIGSDIPVEHAEIIDDIATGDNFLAALADVQRRADGDDLVIVNLEAHGNGYYDNYAGSPRNVAFHGYNGCEAIVDHPDGADQFDMLESEYEFSVFCGGGLRTEGVPHWDLHAGLDQWVTDWFPGRRCTRWMPSSHYEDVYVEGLGWLSDGDEDIDWFTDYLLGDFNQDGKIDVDAGEVWDYDGDGVAPYSRYTGVFDEDDWGPIDGFTNDYQSAHSPLRGYGYRYFDAGLDNHLDVDVNPVPGEPLEVDGTDLDNNGTIDGIDLNGDGDMADWVAINETLNLSDGSMTDDQIAAAMEPIQSGAKVMITNTCHGGGFVDDLSGPDTIIIAGSREDGSALAGVMPRLLNEALSVYQDEADTDVNGRVSISEAFNHVSLHPHSGIGKGYDDFQYDDNGDQVSHEHPLPDGGDGAFGATVFLPAGPRLDLDGDDSSGVVGSDYQATFTEGAPAVSIVDDDGLFTDPDGSSVNSLTVAITNLQDAPWELLDADVGGTTLSKSYDVATGVLSLTGDARPGIYQQVLQSITYQHVSADPTPVDRSITFVAQDGPFESNSSTTIVSISPANEAPILDAIGDKEVDELTELTFTVTATDDGLPEQTLSYSLMGGPDGAVIDPETGEFRWTPGEGQDGEHTFTVVVSDGELSDSEEITVTVAEVNVAPVLDLIGDKETNELVEVAFTAVADDEDVPEQALEFSLVDAPDGATIDPETGEFSWTPTEGQDGEHTFTVVVSDGELSDSEEIMVTVAEVNVAPVLDLNGDKETNELVEVAFAAVADDEDVPQQALEFSLVDAPDGATIDPETGEFSWTPTEGQDGEHTFTVVVSDGELSDSEEITVTVAEVNVAPVLDLIGDKETNELVGVAFTAVADDEDVPEQALEFSLVDAPDGATIDSVTGEFRWTPTERQDGEHTFTVVVSDGELSDSEEITVTVAEVNVAPVLDLIGDKETNELVEAAFTAVADDEDVPEQALEFSLVDAPDGATIDPETGQFRWTPTEGQDGEHTFTVVVSDGKLSDSEEITVTVAEVNVAPVLDLIGDKETNELVEVAFTAVADDEDVPAQALEFSLVDAPGGATIDSVTGEFRWTPTEGQDGEHTFTVTVTDGELSDSEEITVTVAEVPDPVDLGVVDFRRLAGLDVSGGDLWYEYTAVRAGRLTTELSVASGSVEVGLYADLQSEPLVSGNTNTNWRFDDTVEAGETCYVRIGGDSTDVTLTIANLVVLGETEIHVYGTEGDDEFRWYRTTSDSVSINGIGYSFEKSQFETFVFDGGVGDDTAFLQGGEETEIATFFPDHGTFGENGYLVTVNEVTSITAEGGGGGDSAFLYDSPGDDTFVSRPGYGKLSGDGFVLETIDFLTNYGYAINREGENGDGGSDVATMEDATYGDKFKFDWPKPGQFFGKMYGGGSYYNRAKNFDQIEAVMSEGKDRVRLFDSEGDDTFYGQKDESRLVGDGFDVTVSGYDTLAAYASVGNDVAHLEDSEDDDTTRARPHKITLWGGEDATPTYEIMARRFDEYRFEGKHGGYDRAKLHDTALGDHVDARGNSASLYKNDGELDLLYEVVAFEWVKLYATDNDSDDTLEKEDSLEFQLLYDEGLWEEL